MSLKVGEKLGSYEILAAIGAGGMGEVPAPASMEYALYRGNFPVRGFSLNPDGKSFLTSVFRARTQIYLMRGYHPTTRLLDWLRPSRTN